VKNKNKNFFFSPSNPKKEIPNWDMRVSEMPFLARVTPGLSFDATLILRPRGNSDKFAIYEFFCFFV
jgi:hypothetical protein